MSSRTYHDPLHGGIALNSDDPAEALVLELVDAALVEPDELVLIAAELVRPLVQLVVLEGAIVAPRVRHERVHLPELGRHRVGVEGGVDLVGQQRLGCERLERLRTEALC